MSFKKILNQAFRFSIVLACMSYNSNASSHISENEYDTSNATLYRSHDFREFGKGRVKPRELERRIKEIKKAYGSPQLRQNTKGSHQTFHKDLAPSATLVHLHGKQDKTYSPKMANRTVKNFLETLMTTTVHEG